LVLLHMLRLLLKMMLVLLLMLILVRSVHAVEEIIPGPNQDQVVVIPRRQLVLSSHASAVKKKTLE